MKEWELFDGLQVGDKIKFPDYSKGRVIHGTGMKPRYRRNGKSVLLYKYINDEEINTLAKLLFVTSVKNNDFIKI